MSPGEREGPVGGPFGEVAVEKHVSLATLRRSGEAVRTPVWFAELRGGLYVRTLADSGKVRRIRRDPRVRVAACTREGRVTGDWIDAEARLLGDSGPEVEAAERALDAKYGQERREMTRLMREQGRRLVYLAVSPPGPGGRAKLGA